MERSVCICFLERFFWSVQTPFGPFFWSVFFVFVACVFFFWSVFGTFFWSVQTPFGAFFGSVFLRVLCVLANSVCIGRSEFCVCLPMCMHISKEFCVVKNKNKNKNKTSRRSSVCNNRTHTHTHTHTHTYTHTYGCIGRCFVCIYACVCTVGTYAQKPTHLQMHSSSNSL